MSQATGAAAGSSTLAVAGGPSITDLEFLQAMILDRAGVDIGVDRAALWASRLSRVIKEQDLSDLAAVVRALRVGNSALEDAVIDAMTTHETSFFRDGPTFDDIASTVIPNLVERLPSGRPLTIWFAASSSGQEIYSLGMRLILDFPDLVRSGRVRLLATDISTAMVERCHQGRYSDLEVRRGLSESLLNRFFDRTGDSWVVRSQLRDLVMSRQLNLLGSLAPVPQVDLVLIRNVLIYFSDEDKLTVLRNIKKDVLSPEGALILGASEILGGARDDFVAENLPNGVCYRPRG